jgi:hypothetical protein
LYGQRRLLPTSASSVRCIVTLAPDTIPVDLRREAGPFRREWPEKRSVVVLYLCYVLFGLGFLVYVAAALFFIGEPTGETLSDVGNALMLTTAVLLLLRLSAKRSSKAASDG